MTVSKTKPHAVGIDLTKEMKTRQMQINSAMEKN